MRRCTVWIGNVFTLGLIVFLAVPGLTWAQKFDWQMHKGTSIRIMANKNASGEAIQALVPDFEKLTGIKAQYETFTEDQYRQKVLLELAAGTGGVDVIQTATAQEGLKFWRSGWYEPLDEYLKNPRLTDPNYDLADISKPALAGNTYDGKLVALPTTQQTTMLYYRKSSQIMAVPVSTAATFSAGVPVLLMSAFPAMNVDSGISYDITSDGKYFVTSQPVRGTSFKNIAVVLHWVDDVKKLASNDK